MQRKFNHLSRPTFRWTKSNYTELSVKEVALDMQSSVICSGDIDIVSLEENQQVVNLDRFMGANKELLEASFSGEAESIRIHVADGEQATLRLEVPISDFHFDWLAGISVLLGVGANLDLTIVFSGNTIKQGVLNYALWINLAKDARLNVTKIHVGNTKNTVVEHRYACIAESASMQWVAAEFGAQSFVLNSDVDLSGDGAKVSEEYIYIADADEVVDLYYNRNHYGKNTDSHLATFGALKGAAKKYFRGCIDFKSGASGSVGNEEDSVVMLSPNVTNVSVPLLLCTEDDVQGNHASSSGQLDTDKLFYLMSRGLSYLEAKRLIVEAMLYPVIEKINDNDLRQAVLERVKNKMEGGYEG